MAKDDPEVRILRALENPKYRWRTIRGIAKETDLPPEVIQRVVTQQSDQVVMASVPNTKGEALFASRARHRIQTSAFRRIVSALRNRGD